MSGEVVVRRRVHPLGAPKPLPVRRDRWPRTAVVLYGRPDATRRTEAAAVLFLSAGAVVRELVYAGTEPSDDLPRYIGERRAHTVAGTSRRIGLLSRNDFGRLLRAYGYRRGDATVTAGVAPQLVGFADHWSESTQRPGVWSLGLAGLGSAYRDRPFKLYRDAPAVLLTTVGDVVLARWGRTAPDEVPANGKRRRPPARQGPIVDVLNAGAALAGRAVSDLASTCAAFSVDIPDLGEHPLDRLRADALSVAALYLAELTFARELDLGLDISTLASTGGVGTALLREAGVPAIRGRLDLPHDTAGATASAFAGGLGAAFVLHVPVPAVEADMSGTFARAASAVGIQDFLVAGHIETKNATRWAPRLLGELAEGSRRLNRETLRRLGRTLVRVDPADHVLPLKAVRDGEARLAMAPTNLTGWWWATDVLAGAEGSDGHLPRITRAVELVPVSVLAGLRPIRLPSGRVVDLRKDDLALVLIEERLAVKSSQRDPGWRLDLLDGLLKRLAVACFYGNLARIDRERLAAPAVDEGIGPDGERVSVRHPYSERPGPFTSLALAGMVTAMARLMVCRALARVEAAGGSVLAVNIDSLLVAATHAEKPQLVSCPGGRHRLGVKAAIMALPVEEVTALLDADDDLFCPSDGHLWKREAGFDRSMTAYVSGVYRYALVDEAGGSSVATEAQLGGLYADPTGTTARTPEGHFRWAIEAHLAVARAGIAWDRRGPTPELVLPAWGDRPLLRTGQARTPEQLARLQRAFPEHRVRPFMRYLQAVLDPLHTGRRVVAVTCDVHLPPEQWLKATWRDLVTGEQLALATSPNAPPGILLVRTIRELLLFWRIPVDSATEPVEPENHILRPGVRRVLAVRSRPELVELVGKEGDDLYASLIDPGAVPGADLTIYRAANTWAPFLDRARRLGFDELCRRTGLARSTAYHLLAGRPPSHETEALVGVALKGRDLPVIEEETVDGWHPCGRPGCGRPVRRRQRWCSPGCRKAVQRAADRLALHKIGGSRCRRCGTVLVGEHDGPCPGCTDRSVAIAVICPGCGIERVGDTDLPCQICERRRSA